jgi:hypothetical protein
VTAPGGALEGFGWGIERREASAYSCGAECGVEFGHGFGDLFTGEFIAVCLAFGVGGEEIGPGGHECFVVLAGGGPINDGFGVEVPALAALRHPQPAGLFRAGWAVVLAGRSAGHGHHVDTPRGGVDSAHGQRSNAYAVFLGEGLGDISAQGQRRSLSPGQPGSVEGGGFGRGHQRVTSSVTWAGVARWRRVDGVTVVVALGARSAPMPLVTRIPP